MIKPMLLTTLFWVAMGCSHVQTIDRTTPMTLTDLAEKGDEFVEKIKSNQGVVIHLKKGDTLPVALNAALPFATLQAGENQLVATQDIYFYISQQKMLIGKDGIHFTPLHDMKGLKKIFGFKKGYFQVGFAVTKENGPNMTISVGGQ